ncbi:hypothetical protein D3OALGA1CA_5190 [Olavius algarvensis associated proteobacterium Delta 3]|nr:hypothetical protein D3OALGB2SA_2702 [Olavius algarvensis associated proteobacterium Delta 3]CAB5163182.1 hypothetical protein D3OALGA1CA_5190 [Olavius algarvensis associated proteobacterium Delta 3]
MSSLALDPKPGHRDTGAPVVSPDPENTQILIVDDDEIITESINEFMVRSGYRSFMAHSGEAALEFLATSPVDVVITDIMMPGLDGLELTDQIRSLHHNTDVIVMTGYGGDYSYEEAIQKGASDFVFKPIRFEELLLRLKRVLNERRLKHERAEMLSRLKQLAITDDLTRLYNSRHFYNQLELEVDRSNRYNNPLSLLLMDIDHFKNYNDAFGHLEGNKVLVRIGQIIRSLLRKMDSAYRYGGEEFTVILPETNGQEARTVAERINAAIESETYYPAPGTEARITISIGLTEYETREDIKTFISRSDKAMYKSKLAGRNRVSTIFVEDTPDQN